MATSVLPSAYLTARLLFRTFIFFLATEVALCRASAPAHGVN